VNARRRAGLTFIAALIVATAAPATRLLADQAPIKIGIIFSYTGNGATPWGGRSLDAVIAAFQKTYGDTVAGRKVVIVRRDDTGIAPDVAKRQAQELIVQDGVDILAGTTVTPNAISVGDVSTQSKKPFLVFSAATAGIIAKNPYVSRWGHTNTQITVPLAKFALKSGLKTAYALFQDYGPGIDAGKTFEDTFTAGGGKMLGEVRVPITNVDYSAYVQRVRDAHPQALFVFLNPAGGSAEFLRACKDAGFAKAGIKILATGEIVEENNLPNIGDAALGVVSGFEYSRVHDSNLNRQFIRAFNAADTSGDQPDFGDVAEWDALAAIYRALEAQKGNADPDKLMESIKGMKFESPRGPIEIDPQTREITQNVYIRRVERRNGILANYEIAVYPMVNAAGQ
jgi:branched-chain amino acid transport system substrate-binding protein